MEEVFKLKTQNEWVKIFDSVDCCVSPLLNREEAWSLMDEISFKTSIGFPIKEFGVKNEVENFISDLGGDNDNVLMELGYSKEEIQVLKQNKVI